MEVGGRGSSTVFNKEQKIQPDSKANGIPLRIDKKRKCRVVYSYTPVNDDELELEVDSVIDVLEEVEEGWWRGILNGKIGVFPSNFVEELPGSSRDVRSSKDSSSSDSQDKYLYKDNTDSTIKDIKPKPVRGVGLGNIMFQEENVRLKPSQDASIPEKKLTPPKKPPPPTQFSSVNDAPVLPPKPVREQAKVLFAYDACNEDELTLREGDVINIISKEIEDKGWWKGELNNKIGVFPDNFVEILPTTEIRMKKPERPSLINKGTPSRPLFTEVVEKASDAPPPLPDYPKKITEILKKDEKPERPEKPSPPLPGKKPQLPPPLKKPQKPLAPAPPTTETLTDDMKVKNQALNLAETTVSKLDELAFDSIELTTDKLTHLTATRVRHPHRRPPSHLFLKDTSSTVLESQNGDVLHGVRETKSIDYNSNSLSAQLSTHKEFIYETDSPVVQAEPTLVHEKPTVQLLKKEPTERPVLRPPLPKPSVETVESHLLSGKSKPYGLPPKPSAVTKDETLTKPLPQVAEARLMRTSGEETAVILEMRQEVLQLKNQVLTLQQSLDKCHTMYGERIEELSKELDSERKIRLTMQVEIERLKKLFKDH